MTEQNSEDNGLDDRAVTQDDPSVDGASETGGMGKGGATNNDFGKDNGIRPASENEPAGESQTPAYEK